MQELTTKTKYPRDEPEKPVLGLISQDEVSPF